MRRTSHLCWRADVPGLINMSRSIDLSWLRNLRWFPHLHGDQYLRWTDRPDVRRIRNMRGIPDLLVDFDMPRLSDMPGMADFSGPYDMRRVIHLL